MRELVVLSTLTSRYFAERIVEQIPSAVYLGTERNRFNGGERYDRIEIDEWMELVGKNVIFVASIITDDDLNEVCRVGTTAAQLGAHRVVYVIPFEGYTTMDRPKKPGEVVSAKDVARRLSQLQHGDIRNAFLFLDLHTPGFLRFFEGDCFRQQIEAREVIAEAIEKLGLSDFDFASVDLGRPDRIEYNANRFGTEIALISKSRNQLGKSSVNHVIGQVDGRTLFISDDMIRSADSLLNGVTAYEHKGAKAFFAEATHLALDSPDVIDRLLGSPIQKIVTTNSHAMSQHPKVAGSTRFIVEDVSHLFINPILKLIK